MDAPQANSKLINLSEPNHSEQIQMKYIAFSAELKQFLICFETTLFKKYPFSN